MVVALLAGIQASTLVWLATAVSLPLIALWTPLVGVGTITVTTVGTMRTGEC